MTDKSESTIAARALVLLIEAAHRNDAETMEDATRRINQALASAGYKLVKVSA